MTSRLLIVDDDSDAAVSLSRVLSAKLPETSVSACGDEKSALAHVERESPEVIVLDLCLDEKEGVDSGFRVLKKVREINRTSRVIVLTGHGSDSYGVRALQAGAASFLQKPADIPHLVALIQDGIEQARLKRTVRSLEAEQSAGTRLVGSSESIERVREELRYAAATHQSVLLSGATGTGKGVCAKLVHELSTRSGGRFVRYQPSAEAPDLVGSELFGHKKGAFTGAEEDRTGLIALADGGTLFLDEFDELPGRTQVALLGVLQDKKIRPLGSDEEIAVDFRLICATNANLEECLASRKLREDLYHRIAQLEILLPKLSERHCDVPELAEHFLRRTLESADLGVVGFAPESLAVLTKHDWPGNVRELQAVVEDAANRAHFGGRSFISPLDIRFKRGVPSGSSSSSETLSFHEQISEMKLRLVREALDRNDGNQVQAAKEIGLDRTSLRRILEKG